MIKQLRESSPNVLVLDAGDALIRDRPPALRSKGKSSVELMNMMDYDAMALGAGDLALLGVDLVRQRMDEARFPFLSANVVLSETGQLLTEPYVIREIQGYRIAIIGLTEEVRLPGVQILDPLTSLEAVLDDLRGKADIRVLLSHAGFETNQEIAWKAPDVDLIISGGGQGLTSAPQLGEGRPPLVHADTSSTGHAGRRVGVGSWWFGDGGRLVALDWTSVALATHIPDDPDMARWAAANP
jgi:2',3'-cyclic-nucleotide 2'-phosphodiesterase (5'-nucleotidase family)